MRTIPGMTVICPADAYETTQAVKAMVSYDGPCYLRLGRSPVENVTDSIPDYKFEIGKGVQVKAGTDVTIIATGLMLQIALEASDKLATQGIKARVIDIHTIKPIDSDIIIQAAKETGAIVTVEEHNIIGGLGSAVLEVIGDNHPIPVSRLGVEDVFGHSGTAEALMKKYGLTVEHILEKVQSVLVRKNNL